MGSLYMDDPPTKRDGRFRYRAGSAEAFERTESPEFRWYRVFYCALTVCQGVFFMAALSQSRRFTGKWLLSP